MLEAAFLLPFLLFTSLACWDAARLLNAHSVLLQNADDLARWASSDPELSPGEFQVSFTGPTQNGAIQNPKSDLCVDALGYNCQRCSGMNCAGSCGGASTNISTLCTGVAAMESTGIPEIREASAIARMAFISTGVSPGSRPDRVEVMLSAYFDGIFFLQGQKMQVKKTVPYLGPRSLIPPGT